MLDNVIGARPGQHHCQRKHCNNHDNVATIHQLTTAAGFAGFSIIHKYRSSRQLSEVGTGTLYTHVTRIICALLIVVRAHAAAAHDLIGQVSIVDGDTLDIHDERIRLWGIDAPESSQLCRGRDRRPYRCGAQAANALDAFTRAKTVRCTPLDGDRYGRIVARCAVGKIDLGRMLVSRGFAIEEPQYSHGTYAADQLAARNAHRGVWAGRFAEPSFYRACMHAGGGRVAECSDGGAR
jgi:endonuclease YncB( thermonuclease family)